jgi:hypothetical protein
MPKFQKKNLCEIVKKNILKDHFEEYSKLVGSPHFICEKCGRGAKAKKNLCKPKKIFC